MTTLAFFLEEESARHMLEGLLPRLLPQGVHVRYIVFEGKQDLRQQLARRLRGWRAPDTRFVVLHDQDSSDCRTLKEELQAICRQSGRPETLVRIACRELESFYLGDLEAVEQAFGLSGLTRQQERRMFREPDSLNNAAQELRKLTGGTYQKLRGSRDLGVRLRVDGGNRSVSFGHLLEGIQRIAT